MIQCSKCGARFSTLVALEGVVPVHVCRSAETAELPFQTFERVTGEPWPGGKSEVVGTLLKIFRIEDAPGSASANLGLQSYLISVEEMFEPFRVEGRD